MVFPAKLFRQMYTYHNCQKTQKVITFSRFLIEHPVFIMYMVYIHLKKKKSGRKKNCSIFFGSDKICAHDLPWQAAWAKLPPKQNNFLVL